MPTVATERAIKKLAALIASASVFATSAAATPAAVTATVNLRSGPGTGYGSFGSIQEGSPLDVSECDASGAWCTDKSFGRDGFVNGKYINRTKPDRPPWPRSLMTGNGATLTLSQPQFTGWPAFTELKASDDAKPIYGVISVSGKTVVHDDTDQFVITDIKATQLDFSAPDLKELTDLAREVGNLMPRGPITVSQERLADSLVDYKRLWDVDGIKSDLPKIFVSDDSAIFVQTDGKEVLSPIKGIARLQFVVDTNHAAANNYAWAKTTASLLATAGTYGNGIKVPTSVYMSSNYFIAMNFGAGMVAPPISPTPSASPSASQSATPTVPTTSSVTRSASQTPNPTPTSGPLTTGGIVVLGRSFPNETNTGVPDNLKASLTPYTGPCTITAADVKIDRKVITCDQLRLLGPNTSITNSIINGTVHSDCCYLNGSYNLTDSEVRGPGSTATVIGEARFKLLRVEVSGGSRSVNCNATCEIRDSYVHGQYGDKRGIDHESGIRQGSHGTFVHNTISCDAIAYPNPDGGEGSGCSAAVSGYGDFGTVNNNTFTNNLIESREGLTGQAASSYCVYGGSTTGKPYPNAHHIVFTDNIFRRGGMGKCGIYGPVTSFDSNAEGSLWKNNLWDDGATVPPAN